MKTHVPDPTPLRRQEGYRVYGNFDAQGQSFRDRPLRRPSLRIQRPMWFCRPTGVRSPQQEHPGHMNDNTQSM